MPDPSQRSLNVLPTTGAAGKLAELRSTAAPASEGGPDVAYHFEGEEPDGLRERIAEQIRLVFDPEIPVNVYDLGLIYAVRVDAAMKAKIEMTLTAPGCPVAGELPAAVARRVEELAEINAADFELVWEPAWDKGRMSEVARLELDM